ncbi:MAG: hypothetical protein ACP5GR_00735 [Thermoplasmata archaeon]
MKEIDIPENIMNDIFIMNFPISKIKNSIILSTPFILLFYLTKEFVILIIIIILILIPLIKVRGEYIDVTLYKNFYYILSRKNVKEFEIEKYASIRKVNEFIFKWNDKLSVSYSVKYVGSEFLDDEKKEELKEKFIEILNLTNFDITIFNLYDEIPDIRFEIENEYSNEIKILINNNFEKRVFLKTFIVFSSKNGSVEELESLEKIISNISSFEFNFNKMKVDEFSYSIWRLWSLC